MDNIINFQAKNKKTKEDLVATIRIYRRGKDEYDLVVKRNYDTKNIKLEGVLLRGIHTLLIDLLAYSGDPELVLELSEELCMNALESIDKDFYFD